MAIASCAFHMQNRDVSIGYVKRDRKVRAQWKYPLAVGPQRVTAVAAFGYGARRSQ
jgi:hypothetical protein